jgi:hypothetical protein
MADSAGPVPVLSSLRRRVSDNLVGQKALLETELVGGIGDAVKPWIA